MHKRFVANIVSRVVLIVCFAMMLPLGWAIHDDPHSREATAFIFTIVSGLVIGSSFLWTFRLKKEDLKKISAKDCLTIVGLSWVSLSLLGALPLFLSGAAPSYADGFFEIVSGFTTTGATIFKDVEILPRGILFWRSLTHWLGGLGIVVLYVALLPLLGQGTFQLYKAEASGFAMEKVEPRLKETSRILWGIYSLITIVTIALLMLGKMPVFDAICHAFGAVSTGGFSTKNAGMMAYSPYIQWVIVMAMYLGAVSFILHYEALRGNFKVFLKNEEFRFFTLVILGFIVGYAFILNKSPLISSPVRDAAFQVVSIITCTGYVSANYDFWPGILKFGLLILMFMGGCAGSTSGGFKSFRALLTTRILRQSVVQTVFPNAILPVKLNGKTVPDDFITAVLSYFVLLVGVIVVGTAALIVFENCDLVTALSACMTCLSNCGPGLEKVGAVANFAWFSIPSKWILSFIMLAGRLEVYALLILFVPSTWKK